MYHISQTLNLTFDYSNSSGCAFSFILLAYHLGWGWGWFAVSRIHWVKNASKCLSIFSFLRVLLQRGEHAPRRSGEGWAIGQTFKEDEKCLHCFGERKCFLFFLSSCSHSCCSSLCLVSYSNMGLLRTQTCCSRQAFVPVHAGSTSVFSLALSCSTFITARGRRCGCLGFSGSRLPNMVPGNVLQSA